MGGLSFLSKKRWHPTRIDNQKRLFIREQAVANAVERNKVAAEEIKKEQDIAALGRISHMEENDVRNSELKFMYCQPATNKSTTSSSSDSFHANHVISSSGSSDASATSLENPASTSTSTLTPTAPGEDDELTRVFKEKLLQRVLMRTGGRGRGEGEDVESSVMNTTATVTGRVSIAGVGSTSDTVAASQSQNNIDQHKLCGDGDNEAGDDENDEDRRVRLREEDRMARRNQTGRYSASYGARAVQSTLEKEIGRQHRGAGMSQMDLEARFPQLKNAPVEGDYASAGQVQISHKPFAGVVRYVQCRRCGLWGHAAGDRECSLREYNPRDLARQQQEDPMASHLSAMAVAANARELTHQQQAYSAAVAGMAARGVDSQTLRHIRNKNIVLKSNLIATRATNRNYSYSDGGSGYGQVVNFGGGDTKYELVESDGGEGEEEEKKEEAVDISSCATGGSMSIPVSVSVPMGMKEELALLDASNLSSQEKRLLVTKLRDTHASRPELADAVSDLLDLILYAESRGVNNNDRGDGRRTISGGNNKNTQRRRHSDDGTRTDRKKRKKRH